ncbi:MAG: hypothetical protein ACT4OK_06250 [Gemmobacter sp.]
MPLGLAARAGANCLDTVAAVDGAWLIRPLAGHVQVIRVQMQGGYHGSVPPQEALPHLMAASLRMQSWFYAPQDWAQHAGLILTGLLGGREDGVTDVPMSASGSTQPVQEAGRHDADALSLLKTCGGGGPTRINSALLAGTYADALLRVVRAMESSQRQSLSVAVGWTHLARPVDLILSGPSQALGRDALDLGQTLRLARLRQGRVAAGKRRVRDVLDLALDALDVPPPPALALALLGGEGDDEMPLARDDDAMIALLRLMDAAGLLLHTSDPTRQHVESRTRTLFELHLRREGFLSDRVWAYVAGSDPMVRCLAPLLSSGLRDTNGLLIAAMVLLSARPATQPIFTALATRFANPLDWKQSQWHFTVAARHHRALFVRIAQARRPYLKPGSAAADAVSQVIGRLQAEEPHLFDAW